MRAVILTEDSPTTAPEGQADQLIDYYEGAFGSVRSLAQELASDYEVTVLIHSEEHGTLRGTDSVSVLEREAQGEDAIAETSEQFQKEAAGADLVFISLTTSSFKAMITPNWQDLLGQAKKGAIWGLSAARSGLESVDLDALRQKVQAVVTYERAGVARIGRDARARLLEASASYLESEAAQ